MSQEVFFSTDHIDARIQQDFWKQSGIDKPEFVSKQQIQDISDAMVRFYQSIIDLHDLAARIKQSNDTPIRKTSMVQRIPQ
jgi:hypothetical protein